MFVSATVFFFAIAAHQRFATTLSRMFEITCIFTKLQPHQAKTNLVTSSFLPVFCNRNHTAIRVQSHYDKICNQLHSGLQLSFFCNRSTSVVANTLQRMLQSPVFWPGCNPSSKDHPSCNLTVSWHRAFFYPCFFTRVFLKLFLFCKITTLRLQSHCYKGASKQSHHILVSQLLCLCNCHTSAVATTCKECCNLLYMHQVATTNLVAIW
jgi:hypothetical protein